MKLDANPHAQKHDPGNGRQCQCPDCKAVRVRRMSEFDHGTKQGYKIGCRCEKCVAARKRYDEGRKR